MGKSVSGISEYQKDGKTFYKVNTTFMTKDNQPYKKGKQGFKSFREAMQWKVHTAVEISEKTLYELDSKKTEINSAISQYIKYKGTSVTDNTILKIKFDLKRVSDYFGNKKLQDIKIKDIEGLYASLINSGNKASSINLNISHILGFVDWLELMEYIDRTIHNKFHLIFRNLNTTKGEKKDYFELDEVKAILSTFDTEKPRDKRYKLFFTTLFYTGMRKGEAKALMYSDVDFENNTISVTKQVKNVIQKDGSVKTEVKEGTKTNVNKVVEVPAWLVAFIKEEMINDIDSDNDYIFFKKISITDRKLKERFDTACDDAGVERRKIHATRHTYTTMLIDMGANMKFAQKQLGHTNENTTRNVYDHISEQRRKQGAEIVNNFECVV